MTLEATIKPQSDVSLSDAEFQVLSEFARREFGLSLSDAKKSLVSSRLSRRFKARSVSALADYMQILDREGPDGEKQELISALTTNVTSFFRENHHFETLQTDAITHLKNQIKQTGRARIWSAACSTGQEPYSIAMSLLKAWPECAKLDVRILATDIDTNVVDKARKGVYPLDDLESIPAALRKDFVSRQNTADQTFEISEQVKKLISFASLNLMEDWPFKGKFDVIFCRNVAIYFDKPTQQALWARFCKYLAEDAFLFIGHSERVSGPASAHLSGIGITSYRKTANAPKSGG